MASLYKYQKNWIAYLTTCESLQHERYVFITDTKPYQGKDSFNFYLKNYDF
jgi:hypothetical protein